MMKSSLRASALALISAAMLLATAAPPVRAADAATAGVVPEPRITLPAKPSEMLRAPQSTWDPVLKQVAALLDERAVRAEALGKPAQIELAVQRTVLAQAQRAWAAVLDGVSKSRQLQESESGRQTAGLLNEVLARQALDGGDAAWLQRALRERVLSMPWADVGPTIRTLREQLAAAKAEAVEAYVGNKLDLAAAVSSNAASVGFIMQLLGMRFQLGDVMPQRDALVAGLDEAIAQRDGAK